MAVGIRQAALGAEQWPEASGHQEDILGFFRAPPVVFRATVLMVGDDHVVELAGGEGVAVEVEQRAVADAVGRYVGVAMQVAAQDAVVLRADVIAIAANGGDVGRLVRMHGLDAFGRRLAKRYQPHGRSAGGRIDARVGDLGRLRLRTA